jgi:hypothetical protein
LEGLLGSGIDQSQQMLEFTKHLAEEGFCEAGGEAAADEAGANQASCSYELHAHSAVIGHNIGDPIEGLTAEECQAQCDAVPSCRAVDYATFRNAGSRTAYAAGECILNDGAGYSDHSESDGYMNLDSYIKGACGANQAGDGIGFHNPLCDYARKAVEGICCDVRPRCASLHLPQLRIAPKPWPRG